MEQECPICLCTINEGVNALTVECCKNKFHTSCYSTCMKYNKMCPLCRTLSVVIEIPVDTEIVPHRCVSRIMYLISFLSLGYFLISVIPHN